MERDVEDPEQRIAVRASSIPASRDANITGPAPLTLPRPLPIELIVSRIL